MRSRIECDQAIMERDAERAEREKLQSLYEHVRHLLRKANDRAYGSKSEQLKNLPSDQLQLALEDLEDRYREEMKRLRKRKSLRCRV